MICVVDVISREPKIKLPRFHAAQQKAASSPVAVIAPNSTFLSGVTPFTAIVRHTSRNLVSASGCGVTPPPDPGHSSRVSALSPPFPRIVSPPTPDFGWSCNGYVNAFPWCGDFLETNEPFAFQA